MEERKKRSNPNKQWYTRHELVQELKIPESVLSRYFPKADDHFRRNGKRVAVWSRHTVERLLQQRRVQRAIQSAQRSGDRKQAALDFLSTFDIENLRQEAAALQRRFVLHIGPTNSGKTWQSLQALEEAASGVYLGPLRLLALEMFDKLNHDGVPCHLLTGEESIWVGNAKHTASTIELADYDKEYETAVIDEAQMITDASRGDRWMRAIYGLKAAEIHICMAPEARTLICGILNSFHAPYTIVEHKRLAPLVWQGTFSDFSQTQPGDALIVFSRKAVLATAAELQRRGISASVIYGALPPVSRREEVRRFTEGETSVVVATDAIGMGVSLPIRRIVFLETEKFDGLRRRTLRSGEIKQVAGRAGRYGIYDKGYVLSMTDAGLVHAALTAKETQQKRMIIPFPTEALEGDFPMDLLLSAWNSLPKEEGFSRVDMTDALILYRFMGEMTGKVNRQLLYGMITCPMDTSSEDLMTYWLDCCKAILRQAELPEPPSGTDTLEDCERRYKELDIRHQLLRRVGVEEDRMDEKLALCEQINQFLRQDQDSYLRQCRECGRRLPPTWPSGLCEHCYQRLRRSGRFHR